ncbi:hypothetical protein KKF32_02850 [Patescibacteria group bacterium]|nr:hypothetical protein [Patescibacteria group bacterium]
MNKFTTTLFLIIIFLFGFLFFSTKVSAQDQVNLYLFHSENCPHCKEERAYLKILQEEYKDQLVINEYEVNERRENLKLFKALEDLYDYRIVGVPVTVVGDKIITGYLNDQTTGQEIKRQIDLCLSSFCSDRLGDYINSSSQPSPLEDTKAPSSEIPEEIHLPLFGSLNTKTVSLPVLTMVIGLMDGFNPCAMWALAYLISLLLPMQNRRRMWTLGGTFIIISGLVYFLFMAAWLNLFLFLGFIGIIRLIIGLGALAVGAYNLREYRLSRPGCKVTRSESRQKIFARLREITQKRSLIIALLGVVILALAVNLVEAFCSLGLPAIYTQVLSLTVMFKWQYYLYLLLYIFFFILDDMIVFIIAMITLRAVGLSDKYSRFSHLIGGLVILILGILLIFKPGWLMFG